MGLDFKDYKQPTPKKWRRLGDSFLAVSTMITGYALVEEYKWVAILSLTLGVVGKFLTNFFKEDEGC